MRGIALVGLLAGCAGDPPTDGQPEHLSELGLFEYDDGVFTWSDGVVPYDLNTPLFSDHAVKQRAMALPPGETAAFDPEEAFDFPVGTTLIKSFSFPADLRAPDEDVRIVETRLLVREEDGWSGWPYIWTEDQTDAVLTPGGDGTVSVTLIDEDGASLSFNYAVPARNACVQCHELLDADGDRYTTPIGPKARHLAREVEVDGAPIQQLDHLVGMGLLDGVPDDVPAAFDFREVEARGVADLTSEETERAARDWLDVNCAHCHRAEAANGVTTQLWLDHDQTDPFHLGVCKVPGSAGAGAEGRTWDIVPGDHDASILWYRMATTTMGAMMPLIGRATECPTCSDLVARWIDEMPEDGCH